MSTTTDNRVVSMQFDNKQFERNAQTSINTLKNLNKSLDLKGASKGLENVNSAAKKMDFSVLSSGVEKVQMRFSALQVMAVTALSNITNSAVNAGKRLVSAFTIDPVKTGLAEYETQINAVQTILANTKSKGTNIDDVNRALDDLNAYADKTIYNFTEMTRNIGTFTAAGVDLDKSVTSIKGIANLAAVSGSSSQQASTAMYQLSQALAAGKVSLMDWNSVVNAGMGGELFQEALKRTARNMGHDVDGAIEYFGSFRESLTQGEWLTTDVLTETLSQLSGAYTEADLLAKGYTKEQAKEILDLADTAVNAATKVKTFTQLMDTLKEAAQSGWTQTYEILIGDFEEAKELWTKVSDVFGEMINNASEARNKMLQEWSDLGGRTLLLDSFKNAFEGIMSIIKPVKEAFREVFPPMTAERLLQLTEGLKELTSKFIISDGQAAKLKSTFKGLFSAIDLVLSAIKAVAGPTLKVVGMLLNALLGATGPLGDWITGIRDSAKEADIFGKIIEKVSGFLGLIAVKMGEVKKATKAKMDTPGYERFLSIVEGIWEIFKKLGSKIATALAGIGKAFAKFFGSNTFFEAFQSLISLFNGGLFAGLLIVLNKFANSFNDIAGTITSFKEGMASIFEEITGCLSALQNQIQSKTLRNIAVSIGILAASLLILSLIDPQKLGSALTAVTMLFVELMASMSVFTKIIDGKEKMAIGRFAFSLIPLAAAVLILSAAVVKLAALDWNQLSTGLAGVAGILGLLVGFTAAINKLGGKIAKATPGVIVLAFALIILTDVVKDLAELSWEELARGLVGLAGVLSMLTLVSLALSQTSSKMAKGSVGLVLMGAALEIIADVIYKLSALSFGELIKGLVGLTGALSVLVGVSIALSKTNAKMASVGWGLILFAAGLEILVDVFKRMGSIKWSDILKGIALLAGALGVICGFSVALNKTGSHLVFTGWGLVIFAAGVEVLADALGKMGQMGWSEILKSLVLLSTTLGLIGGLAVALRYTGANLFATAGSLLVFATAIAVLTPPLKSIGSMKWSSIAKGLITLAGVFAVLGLAGLILKPLVPVIYKLSGAMMMFGVGIALVGAGLTVFAAGLTALGVAIGFTGGAILGVTEQATYLIPVVTKAVGEGLKLFAGVIAEAIPSVIAALVVLIDGICQAIVEAIPIILKTIVHIIDALIEYLPQIVDGIVDLIVALFDTLKTRIPELVVAAADFIAAFFGAIFDVLGKIGTDNVKKIAEAVLILAASCLVLSAVGSTGMGAVIGVGILLLLITALGALMIGIGALMNEFPQLEEFLDKAIPVMQKIGFGLGSFIGSIVGGLGAGLTSGLPQIGANLSAFMINLEPFMDGMSKIDGDMAKSVAALAGAILAITAASLLDSITSWLTGGSSMAKFGEQLVPFGESMVAFSDAVAGKIDAEAVTAAANAGKVMAEMADALPNTGGVAGFFAGNNDMDTFGEQLVVYGECIAKFSATVAGKIDEQAVRAAANAGKIMADMADTLPNTGGVAGFFAGNNDMDTFGEQLVVFGESIAKFSESVVDLDEDAVYAAANAGKAMSEMAKTLPNTGGVVSFFTGNNDMDEFGEQLVPFGHSMLLFSESVKYVDPDAVVGAATAGKAMAEMAKTLPNSGGVVSFFTGENSMVEFGKQLIPFGEAMSTFSDSIKGVNPEAVIAAANAGKMMASMADTLPNTGGVAGFFAGNNDMDTFGEQLVVFGECIAKFSKTVSGNVDADAVYSAANAGKMMSEMAKTLPESNGVAQFFAGEHDLTGFAKDLEPFGKAMAAFSKTVSGKIDSDAVNCAANAGKMISELVDTLPETDGVAQWFTGEKNFAGFSEDLVDFGNAMVAFSESVSGKVDTEAVNATTNCGMVLSHLNATLPNTDGLIQKFTGQQDLGKFGEKLAEFGEGMVTFSATVAGKIDAGAVEAATNAGKALAELNNMTPYYSGVKQLFTGEKDLEEFGQQLSQFGVWLWRFSIAAEGINPETTLAAANAGNILAEMTTKGQVMGDFFSGDMTTFGDKLAEFGRGIKGFAESTFGVNPYAIQNGVTAGTYLIDMVNKLPANGGLTTLLSSTNMAVFGSQVVEFGKAIKGFVSTVGYIQPDVMDNAMSAGHALVYMASNLPTNGGFDSFINGKLDMPSFGEQIIAFGKAIASFSHEVSGMDSSVVTNATTAGSALVELSKTIPKSGGLFSSISEESNMGTFVENVILLGRGIREFSDASTGVELESVSNAVDAGKLAIDLVSCVRKDIDVTNFTDQLVPFGKSIREFAETITRIKTDGLANNAKEIRTAVGELSEVGKTAVDEFVTAFSDSAPIVEKSTAEMMHVAIKPLGKYVSEFNRVGHDLINSFINGMKDDAIKIKSLLEDNVKSSLLGVAKLHASAYDIGSNLVSGFVNGIDENTWKVEAVASAMAQAALTAARRVLLIKSPSRKFYEVGSFAGEGFVNALTNYSEDSYAAGSEMAMSATSGLSKAIARIKDAVENDIDSQPTIRPVLDLSDVMAGAGTIGGLLNVSPSVGVLSRVGSISSSMNGGQNGSNGDVIAAIKDLKNTISNGMGNVYIDGVTYDDGSNIKSAIEEIVRAARVGRRV